MADDGHTINLGQVTIGEPLARPPIMADPIDTDLIRTIAIVWRTNGAEATADAIEALCDEVDRLRAENAALAAALTDIADGECMNMDEDCTLLHPTDPGEWCHTCVAEVTWAAWKMGALR